MTQPSKLCIVDLEPVGRRAEARPGDTLLDVAQRAGVEIVSVCGGAGLCDTCRVRVVEGRLSPPSLVEEGEFSAAELAQGWRLACQAEVLGDVRVDIPPESLTTPQRLQVEGEAAALDFDPVITALDVTLDPPTLHDLRPDLARLEAALARAGAGPLALRHAALIALPDALRAHGWRARLAVREGREVVAVLPPGTPLLGLAVDIGTTKVAAYLVDLASGEIAAKAGAMNPQIAYGEDVISRILFVNTHPDERDLLQRRIAEALNGLVAELCAEAGAQPGQVVEAVVVGNTAMHHIFAGLPVRQLGEAPYIPVTGDALTFDAAAAGLRLAPGAYVYLPPNIAGYVGADHVAMLLATDAWRTPRTVVAIDIGTNTEVTLAHGGRRLSCSCASGPAFEGAHIRDGMRAAPGAVERVQIIDGQVHIQTIGGQPPVGICGSGILDAVAVMAEDGVVNHRGAFRPEHPLAAPVENGKPAFVLAPADASASRRAVIVTRSDVAEIQLAKGAIRAGIELLLAEAGIGADAVDEFIIAGAFGTYISVESALRIGMFPRLPLEKFRQVGNAAGMGARQLLVSRGLRAQVAGLTAQIEYIELTTHAGFQEVFMASMSLDEE
jgi:uncharacterized 2Fe-2S/4Fe-4S cluster protein (DUF4445 family)